MCPVFRSHNSVLFFFLVHDSSLDLCTSDANEAYSATGTAYSSEAFYGSCWQIFSFLCSVCGQLSVFWPLYCLSFGHCIVCLLAIVLPVFWPLYCLCPSIYSWSHHDSMVVGFPTTCAISAYHH